MSVVWKHYEIEHENSPFAVCNICNAKISRGGEVRKSFNTTNLFRHLKVKHALDYSKTREEERTAEPTSLPQDLKDKNKRELEVDDSHPATVKKCHSTVPNKRIDFPNQLGGLAVQFMNLLKKATNGELDLNHVSQELQISKRRIYDITNVLQGIKLIKTKSRSVIQLMGAQPLDEKDLHDIIKEEQQLDELIVNCREEIYKLFQEHQRYAYLTHEDVSRIDGSKDQTIIVIKAPAETKVEVSHPHERLQIYVRSTRGPIDVFTCSDSPVPTEKAAGLTLPSGETRDPRFPPPSCDQVCIKAEPST